MIYIFYKAISEYTLTAKKEKYFIILELLLTTPFLVIIFFGHGDLISSFLREIINIYFNIHKHIIHTGKKIGIGITTLDIINEEEIEDQFLRIKEVLNCKVYTRDNNKKGYSIIIIQHEEYTPYEPYSEKIRLFRPTSTPNQIVSCRARNKEITTEINQIKKRLHLSGSKTH